MELPKFHNVELRKFRKLQYQKIMKREPISKEYPVHIVRGGARDLPFARNDSDRWRNLQGLYYLNDSSSKPYWLKDLEKERRNFRSSEIKGGFFVWPSSWPKRDPLVDLAAFAFNKNHDHMIIWPRKEKGLSQFMQKCGISISKHFNEKYGQQGTVLKPYTVKVINSDRYLQWVIPYVMVKNTFEMHPKGYQWAIHHFEEAWQWGIDYPFSSLGVYAGKRTSPIVNTAQLKKFVGPPEEFKRLCRAMIMGREQIKEDEMSEVLRFSFEEEDDEGIEERGNK